MERKKIKVLEDIFDSTDSGLKIVLLEGEEGSGKTELLKFFCDKVSGMSICSYFNVKEFRENLIPSITDSFLKNVKKTFETGRFGILESIGKNVNESERLLFLVSLVSSIKKTVLMFDDVENAPSSLFNILMYLARNQMEKKLMIILTYNPLKQSANLKEFLVRSGEISENILKKIKLEPLTPDEVVYLIADSGYHLPRYLIEKIYSSSRGNLKKIIEILDYFKINRLIDENGYWTGTFEDIPQIESQSVKTYFYSVYDKLSDSEKRFLTSCSVIGEEFSLDEIKAVENIDENEIYNILDKLIMSGIIEEMDKGNFRFKRTEYQSLLYNNEMSGLRRRFLHRKLAEYYERKSPDPYKIGIHYYYARDMERAIKYLEIAALRAYEKNSYKDAIEIFKKVFEISNREQYELIVGECYFRIGDFKNARMYYEKALSNERINALIKIAELEFTLGNLGEVEKILDSLQKEKLSKEQMFYINYLKGVISERRYKFDDASNFYENALKIAFELNNDNDLALIHKQIGIMYFYMGEFNRAEEMYKKSLEYYSRASNFEGIARIYNNLALIETGRNFEKTLEYYELALSYANLSGNIYLLIILNYNIAQINFWNSNIKDAERAIKVAKNLSEIINEFDVRHSIISFLSDVEVIKGNFSEALNYIDKAISISERMDSIFISSFYKLKKFKILSILGEHIPNDQMDNIISIMKKSNPELYEPYAYGEKGKIYIYTGKIDEGINLLHIADKKAREILTFVDYADIIGEIPFSYILKKDFVNFKKEVEEIRDFSENLKANLLHLKAYLPIVSEDSSFEKNEEFLSNSGLKFLLLKMYICCYEFKKDDGLKNKLLKLSNDLGLKLNNFYNLIP